ncbi:hypothetical protein SAMN02910356_00027 [Selenomonas sp. GACV-9]|uniref:hypothetical protein n=1 Tax=Selenomonas sp. GACV-9 TaxID=3158782 RepID=UPI0008DF3B2B|nr:hypothetical protein SAMN02910356_00027 [Selenomonas ruminantium]
MKEKKRLYTLAGVVVVVAVAAGGFLWNGMQSSQNAQVDSGAVTSVEQAKEPQAVTEPAKTEAPAAQKQNLPAEDVVAMTFEGTNTYIVAGSVTGTKNGSQWAATLRNGNAGKLSKVEFKQEGQKLMTRNDDGPWRPVDEMDRSIFNKIQEIVAK